MEFRTVYAFNVPVDFEEIPDHPTEARERFYGRIVVPFIKQVLKMQDVQVTAIGAEHLPAHGPALLAINHTGYYDFIAGCVPSLLRGKRLTRFMAKKEVFDMRPVGDFMNAMHHVPVDRSNGSSAIQPALDHLAKGDIVGIFPEATISRSFELKEFKTGAVRIADQAQVPLIPVIIWGAQRIVTKGLPKNLGRSHIPVLVLVGSPVDPSGDPVEATARLHAAMQELLDEARSLYNEYWGPFPDGENWMPARLGGSAPTPEQAEEIDRKARAAKQAKKDAKKQADARRPAERINEIADKALGNMRDKGIIDRASRLGTRILRPVSDLLARLRK